MSRIRNFFQKKKTMITEDKLTQDMDATTQVEEPTTTTEETTAEVSVEERLLQEKEALEGQVSELKDKYLRLRAEFDNYRKRTMKQNLDLRQTAASDTMTVLLPVLDDFDRAQKSADGATETGFSEGIQLVFNKLHTILKQRGLKEMESNGEVFDAELHEAITEIPAPSEELKGKIVDTIEKGYYLNDKIVRHAKVVIGK